MTDHDDIWIPLVDEPIGSIVDQLQAENPDIDALVSGPHKILAFRTFAYIRVGILLGQLLVDHDIPDYDGTETWIDALLRDPEHHAAVVPDPGPHAAVVRELRAVADEIAVAPAYAADEQLGPDEEARARFREFARK